MNLPVNSLIAHEKLTKYLLTPRKRNDKSHWLAQAGYLLEDWQILENHLRDQILTCDATLIENTDYGKMFGIRGSLIGPNGKELSVSTIWLTETETGITKFITMYPAKRR